jgi:hypothetical protein
MLGKAVFIDHILSSHRWHKTSLTYSRRWESVREASKARISNMPAIVRAISFLWEYPVMAITYYSGAVVSSNLVSTLKGRISK